MEVRQAGVVTPRLALNMRGSVFSAAIALAFLIALAFGLTATLGARAVAAKGYSRSSGQYLLRPTLPVPGDDPRGGPGPQYAVEITIEREYRMNVPGPGTITVVVAPKIEYDSRHPGSQSDVAAAGFAKAIVHQPDGPIDVYDAAGVQTGSVMAFERAVAAGLFAAAGLNVPDLRDATSANNTFIATGIDSLTDLVQKETTTPGAGAGVTQAIQGSWNTVGRLNIVGGGVSTARGLQAQWGEFGNVIALGGLGVIWVGVYVVCLWWVARRRRGLMEGVGGGVGPEAKNGSADVIRAS
jgi:hypothetical protein